MVEQTSAQLVMELDQRKQPRERLEKYKDNDPKHTSKSTMDPSGGTGWSSPAPDRTLNGPEAARNEDAPEPGLLTTGGATEPCPVCRCFYCSCEGGAGPELT